MKKNSLIILLLLLASKLIAQNYKEDILAMSKAYTALTSYSMVVKIDGYDELGKLSYNLNLTMKKKGDSYLVKSSLYEMLVNKEYALMVLPEDKEITYRELEGNEMNELKKYTAQTDVTAMVDSLMKSYQKIQYLGLVNNTKAYRFVIDDYLFESTEIYIDNKTKLLDKIIYYYKKDLDLSAVKVVVKYINNLTPDFSTNEFSEQKYFIKKGREYILQPAYKSYSLSNNNSENF